MTEPKHVMNALVLSPADILHQPQAADSPFLFICGLGYTGRS